MGDRKSIAATAFFSASLVLGVVLPLGYLSLQALDQRLESGQIAVKSVIIELKIEALKEIQSAAQQAGKVPMNTAVQTDPAIVASLAQLKTNIDQLRSDQQQLLETLNRPVQPAAITASAALPPPGARDDTLNQTVFFPLGTIKGPSINQQVAAMIPKIIDYGKTGTCLSNVMGFSDTLGNDKSNLALSYKRAVHVAALLRGKNIAVGKVKAWGERWLKVHTVDGIKNEQNRRVVIETECDRKPINTKGPVS